MFRKSLTLIRKIAALVCVAAILCAALTPASSVLYWALLVPFLLFFAGAVVAFSRRPLEEDGVPLFSFLASIPSRAPPLA